MGQVRTCLPINLVFYQKWPVHNVSIFRMIYVWGTDINPLAYYLEQAKKDSRPELHVHDIEFTKYLVQDHIIIYFLANI